MNFLIACFTALLLLMTGCTARDASKGNFNIVLITIDTLRADHLSCYGYERETSPHIDALAKQGILFKDVTAPSSWTAPSMVSLFTSTYPINHGVIHGLPFQTAKGLRQEVFSEKLITLSELLKDKDYTTFGVSSNHTLTAELGFARGFDYFRYVNWMPADIINKIVYSWEDAIKKSNRFFLWVHYIDPHSPYNPRSPWIEHYTAGNLTGIDALSRTDAKLLVTELKKRPEELSRVIALYDSEINYVDAYIGELIERFELDKNTLLIITSDHGEQLMERGNLGHSIDLHKEELHVPLIIKSPMISENHVIERQVSILDIMPTILQLLAIDLPEHIGGTPLLQPSGIWARLKNRVTSRRDSVPHYAELNSHAVLKTIITPPWKYIYDYLTKSDQLYNIISDPREQTNLIDRYPGQSDDLKKQLFSWVDQMETFPTKDHFMPLTPDAREKLETLGYLSAREKEDDDKDGTVNEEDNCRYKQNGPAKGMCMSGHRGEFCTSNEQCGAGGLCSMRQEDADGDGIGDTCDFCEGRGAYDVDGDGMCDEAHFAIEKVWLEAEHADSMVSPLEIAADANASGGCFIHAPNGSGNQYDLGQTIMATYTVFVSRPGVYFIWGRVQARDGNDNSFFVQVDDNLDNLWEVALGEQWHWDAVNDRDNADPARLVLKSGVHKIRVELREDGTKLDKLLLTNDPDFVLGGTGDVVENQVYPYGD